MTSLLTHTCGIEDVAKAGYRQLCGCITIKTCLDPGWHIIVLAYALIRYLLPSRPLALMPSALFATRLCPHCPVSRRGCLPFFRRSILARMSPGPGSFVFSSRMIGESLPYCTFGPLPSLPGHPISYVIVCPQR